MAAPTATASSGLTEKFRIFPLKYYCTIAFTFGIRLDPPTIMISFISAFVILAFYRASVIGESSLEKIGCTISSNFALEIFISKSFD